MNLLNYSSILQNYSKIKQLTENFSSLEFNEDSYCISLSGGVDSMVLLDILYKRDKRIIAIHINYNNREETNLEQQFLFDYCKNRNITLFCHSFDITRGSIKRSDYESFTKQTKFDIYKSTLKSYGLKYVLLAHHKDDIIENIFTNFCRGDNFLNLSVIKESNIIMGVNIVRPLLKYYKQDIYNYAHYYEIPYFLDTTPDWSVRGKFRKKILPLLFDTFNGINSLKNNLLSIAKESDEWGTLVQDKIINKYFKHIQYENIQYENYIDQDSNKTKNKVTMNIKFADEDYSDYPFCFWQEIMSKVFHRYSMSAPSRKSLQLFVDSLKSSKFPKSQNEQNCKNSKSEQNSKNCTIILLKHKTKLIINKDKNIIEIII